MALRGAALLVCLLALATLGSSRIVHFPAVKEFHIYGANSVYALHVGPGGNLVHLAWAPLPEEFGESDTLSSLAFLAIEAHAGAFDPWLPVDYNNGTAKIPWSKNTAQLEFPDYGSGDYRIPAVNLLYSDGSMLSPFVYKSHEIVSGKPVIDEAQPAFYTESSSEATTLRVELFDSVQNMTADLYYTIYAGTDLIIRRTVLRNTSPSLVRIRGLMSASVDLPVAFSKYHLHSLSGSWARERLLVSRPVEIGTQSVGSRRGASSHHHNPFIVLSDGPMSETHGEHFSFGLVYSGGFVADVEMTSASRVRVAMGIQTHNFDWRLQAGEFFASPEIVLGYSANGMGTISRQMHKLIRTRLVKGAWRDRARPILVNSWEAMYFDVSEDKIVELLAEPAAELGMDLVVLDDGWFGTRDDATSGLVRGGSKGGLREGRGRGRGRREGGKEGRGK